MVTEGCDTASEIRVTPDSIQEQPGQELRRGGEGDVDILGNLLQMSEEGVLGLSRVGWLGGKAS